MKSKKMLLVALGAVLLIGCNKEIVEPEITGSKTRKKISSSPILIKQMGKEMLFLL